MTKSVYVVRGSEDGTIGAYTTKKAAKQRVREYLGMKRLTPEYEGKYSGEYYSDTQSAEWEMFTLNQ